MKNYLRSGKKVIIVSGNPKMGSTEFIKKSVIYMKQRAAIDNFLYIDLRMNQ